MNAAAAERGVGCDRVLSRALMEDKNIKHAKYGLKADNENIEFNVTDIGNNFTLKICNVSTFTPTFI